MWFYAVDGTRQGPVAFDQLVTNLHGFANPAAVHVWRDGMQTWQLAGAVPEVAAKLAPPVPLVAAPPPMVPVAIDQDGEESVSAVLVTAGLYRRLVALVGVQMLMGGALWVTGLGGASAAAAVLGLAVVGAGFGVSIAMAITAYRLMSGLDEPVPALWAVPIFVPYLNLLALLVISQKAQKWCRQRGIYVGLLGPSKISLDWISRG